MSVRVLLAGAALIAMAGCNMFPAAPPSNVNSSASRDRDDNRDRDRDRDSADDDRDNREARADDRDSNNDDRSDRGSDDPSLVRNLAQQVLAVRQTLPQRQGPFTIYDVESNGTQLIYYMRTGEDVTGAMWRQFETGLTTELCRNRDTSELINLGGTFTYNVEDVDGETFSLDIDRC